MLEEFSDEDENFDLSNLPPYYAQKLNGFLREACKQGHLTCVEVLVSRGADVNYIDKQEKTTALEAAILSGHNNITEYLYSKASEKTRQNAYSFATDKARAFQEALSILKELPVRDDGNNGDLSVDKGKELKGKEKIEHTFSFTPAKCSVEKHQTLDSSFSELKNDYKQLHGDFNGLQKDYDEIQKRYEMYKTESEDLIHSLKKQIDRLNNELALEKEHNQETEDVLDNLGKEYVIQLKQKVKDITNVKIERDTERRAKEMAKKIDSNGNVPAVKRNPLLDLPDKPKRSNSNNAIDFRNFDIQGKGNRPPTAVKEGSKDDLEIQNMEDRVKYRVRRLVKRWEEMADIVQ